MNMVKVKYVKDSKIVYLCQSDEAIVEGDVLLVENTDTSLVEIGYSVDAIGRVAYAAADSRPVFGDDFEYIIDCWPTGKLPKVIGKIRLFDE